MVNDVGDSTVCRKFELKDRVAVITGGSRGIGRAVALSFAELGADIVLVSRKMENLKKVEEEISQKGVKALSIAANLRYAAEIDKVVSTIENHFSKVDILVNNAGTNPAFDSVLNITEDVWDIIMELNLKSYFFLSQKIAAIMKKGGKGSIINISSEAGLRPMVGLGVYSISKAAVNMLTQVLAQELGTHNIRVNAIAAGIVKTGFAEALWNNPVVAKSTAEDTVLDWIMEPEDLVSAAAYLASDASSHMTGQVLLIDGGHYPTAKKMMSLFKK